MDFTLYHPRGKRVDNAAAYNIQTTSFRLAGRLSSCVDPCEDHVDICSRICFPAAGNNLWPSKPTPKFNSLPCDRLPNGVGTVVEISWIPTKCVLVTLSALHGCQTSVRETDCQEGFKYNCRLTPDRWSPDFSRSEAKASMSCGWSKRLSGVATGGCAAKNISTHLMLRSTRFTIAPSPMHPVMDKSVVIERSPLSRYSAVLKKLISPCHHHWELNENK
jgi:hypothetical protein